MTDYIISHVVSVELTDKMHRMASIPNILNIWRNWIPFFNSKPFLLSLQSKVAVGKMYVLGENIIVYYRWYLSREWWTATFLHSKSRGQLTVMLWVSNDFNVYVIGDPQLTIGFCLQLCWVQCMSVSGLDYSISKRIRYTKVSWYIYIVS